MKNVTKIIASFGLAVLGFSLTSCNNDLNSNFGKPDEDLSSINPIVTPDAIVYSGDQTFTNSFTNQISPSGNSRAVTSIFEFVAAGGINENYKELSDVEKWQFDQMMAVFSEKMENDNSNEIEEGFRYEIPPVFTRENPYTLYFTPLIISGKWSDNVQGSGQDGNGYSTRGEITWDKFRPAMSCYMAPDFGPLLTENGPYNWWEIKLDFDYNPHNFNNVFCNKTRKSEFLSDDEDKHLSTWIYKLFPFEEFQAFPYVFLATIEDTNTHQYFYSESYFNQNMQSQANWVFKDFKVGTFEKFSINTDNYDEMSCFVGYDLDGDNNYLDFVVWIRTENFKNYKDDNLNKGGDKDKDKPVTPDTPDSKEFNEVEVNLSLNEVHTLPNGDKKYDIDDLVSKLSIHVRYPKDVEVIIPVPEKFYCDQDDLYILKDHYGDKDNPNWVYGGTSKTWDNFIDDHNVTLTVEYVSKGKDDLTASGQGYIRVYTEGINEDVIKHCQEKFGDGINFEVYNYYNRGTKYTTGLYQTITSEELQNNYLNHSIINFDWTVDAIGSKTYPDFYINAFNDDKDGEIVPNDCYVWISGDRRCNFEDFYKWDKMLEEYDNYFWNAYKGYHYNGSPYNWIFTAKQVKGSAAPEKDPMPTVFPFNN